MQISFTPKFARWLTGEMKLDGEKVHNPHGGGNTYKLERALNEDMLLTSVGWANSYNQDADEHIDEWGIGWKVVEYDTPFGKGKYTEFDYHPLADDLAIESYQPPDPNRSELYRESEWMIQQFKDEYWIVGVTVTTITT